MDGSLELVAGGQASGEHTAEGVAGTGRIDRRRHRTPAHASRPPGVVISAAGGPQRRDHRPRPTDERRCLVLVGHEHVDEVDEVIDARPRRCRVEDGDGSHVAASSQRSSDGRHRDLQLGEQDTGVRELDRDRLLVGASARRRWCSLRRRRRRSRHARSDGWRSRRRRSDRCLRRRARRGEGGRRRRCPRRRRRPRTRRHEQRRRLGSAPCRRDAPRRPRPSSVSPGSGRRAVAATMSRLALPTTQTSNTVTAAAQHGAGAHPDGGDQAEARRRGARPRSRRPRSRTRGWRGRSRDTSWSTVHVAQTRRGRRLTAFTCLRPLGGRREEQMGQPLARRRVHPLDAARHRRTRLRPSREPPRTGSGVTQVHRTRQLTERSIL